MAGPGRSLIRRAEPHISDQAHWCEGRRRVRRARAGFEIDHSEPQARVWRSRGRPGPTAPRTPAEPQATSSIANSGCGARGRCQGQARYQDNASSHTPAPRPHRCEGRRRDRRARASLQTRGLAAVPVGGGKAWPDNEPTRQTARQHTRPHRGEGRRRDRRARPRCRWAAAGPGRASRSTTPSRQARVWRSRGRAAAHRHTQRPGP